jgi:hypothetical protein
MTEEIVPDSVSIRAIGKWNQRIFTANWVKNNLLAGSSIDKFDMLLNTNELEFGYSLAGIHLFPRQNELSISIEGKENINDERVILCDSVLRKILQLLPQTPIGAIGINVIYFVNADSRMKILDMFNTCAQKYEGIAVSKIIFSEKRDDFTLNIVVSIEGIKAKIEFNYHFEIVDKIQNDKNLTLTLIRDSKRYIQ